MELSAVLLWALCVCVCVFVCTPTLGKSIFVCFAASPDIALGAAERKAVKCDLNILCLHLFLPPSSCSSSPPCSLSHFPFISISSLSITVSSVPVLLMPRLFLLLLLWFPRRTRLSPLICSALVSSHHKVISARVRV